MHAHVGNPKQSVELQQKRPQLKSSSQFSSESREAGLCLSLHPAPLAKQPVFGGESLLRSHSPPRASPPCRDANQGSPAWMERRSQQARPPRFRSSGLKITRLELSPCDNLPRRTRPQLHTSARRAVHHGSCTAGRAVRAQLKRRRQKPQTVLGACLVWKL